jgi:hypothetical protein
LEKIILSRHVLYNHGHWAVLLKTDLEVIGGCGLAHQPEGNEIDLGVLFNDRNEAKAIQRKLLTPVLNRGLENSISGRSPARRSMKTRAHCRVLETPGMQVTREELVDWHWSKSYEPGNPSII